MVWQIDESAVVAFGLPAPDAKSATFHLSDEGRLSVGGSMVRTSYRSICSLL